MVLELELLPESFTLKRAGRDNIMVYMVGIIIMNICSIDHITHQYGPLS